MVTMIPLQTNKWQPEFTSIQISYSTADVEKDIFFAEVCEPNSNNVPLGDITFLVVNEKPFALIDEISPEAIPFSEKSGLFFLADPEK